MSAPGHSALSVVVAIAFWRHPGQAAQDTGALTAVKVDKPPL